MCEINKASEVEAELHINMALEQEVSDLQLMANMLQLETTNILFLGAWY